MSAKRSSHAGHRRWLALAIAIGIASGLSGCASRAPNETPFTSSSGTLRVAMTVSTWSGLDPQGTWGFNQWELLRCCLLRTLMTYRGVPDSLGTEPVPDLAAGPPSVSPDGLTWTFRLRPGIHYGPPFENVEVTAADIVRALLRSDGEEADGPGGFYLPTIEGFSEYYAGETDTITGVVATGRYTLRVRTVRPDTSVTHLFAMAFTAPIPPLPGARDIRFGAATGHPFIFSPEEGVTEEGYGRFLVPTGPYMFEGSPDLDFSAPPEGQVPVAGFVPAWGFEDFNGHVTLVRNPSWDRKTDPNRPALASRIEVAIAPSNPDLFRKLEAGAVDVIVGEDPPNSVAARYRSSASLQKHLLTSAGAWSFFVEINLAQPPFDDVHVRRALALALDRPALAESVKAEQGVVAGSPTTHVVPDPMEGSLLTGWDRFDSENGPDLATAHAEMDDSRYGRNGLCSRPACRGVLIGVDSARTAAILRAALTELGITPTIRSKGDEVDCENPRSHAGACVGGWGADFPDAGTWFAEWRSSSIHTTNVLLLGASPGQLRAWGYGVHRVPSIDRDYERCSARLGMEASLCWARLDQFVVGELAAAIPVLATDAVRLTGPRVIAASFDQAFTEPALDQIAIRP
jgi:peptide/nickel transport system substrate-binding protein